MNSPRYARIAARVLAQQPSPEVEVTEVQREQAVEVMARALAAKTRRRARRAWMLGLAAAAAVAAVGYAGLREVSRPAHVAAARIVSAVASPFGSGTAILRGSLSEPLIGVASLGQGGQLVAGNQGGATVRLSTGTELGIAHDTSVAFESAGPVERFFLTQGVLQAKVAKLGPGERFIVRTPDAEVEVRGTVFQVAITDPDAGCAGGIRTRVSVTEGLVEVRGALASSYVHPGESWPSGCTNTVAVVADNSPHVAPAARKLVAAGRVDAPVERGAGTVFARPDSAAQIQKTPKAASNIAQQNELFSEAAAASRAGDSVHALSSYELLIARYPASPLAESAAVERMNLLRKGDLAAAKLAAHQYLTRYPLGYARNDAEGLLAQP